MNRWLVRQSQRESPSEKSESRALDEAHASSDTAMDAFVDSPPRWTPINHHWRCNSHNADLFDLAVPEGSVLTSHLPLASDAPSRFGSSEEATEAGDGEHADPEKSVQSHVGKDIHQEEYAEEDIARLSRAVPKSTDTEATINAIISDSPKLLTEERLLLVAGHYANFEIAEKVNQAHPSVTLDIRQRLTYAVSRVAHLRGVSRDAVKAELTEKRKATGVAERQNAYRLARSREVLQMQANKSDSEGQQYSTGTGDMDGESPHATHETAARSSDSIYVSSLSVASIFSGALKALKDSRILKVASYYTHTEIIEKVKEAHAGEEILGCFTNSTQLTQRITDSVTRVAEEHGVPREVVRAEFDQGRKRQKVDGAKESVDAEEQDAAHLFGEGVKAPGKESLRAPQKRRITPEELNQFFGATPDEPSLESITSGDPQKLKNDRLLRLAGYYTSAEILEKVKDAHPNTALPDCLVNCTKRLSTAIDHVATAREVSRDVVKAELNEARTANGVFERQNAYRAARQQEAVETKKRKRSKVSSFKTEEMKDDEEEAAQDSGLDVGLVARRKNPLPYGLGAGQERVIQDREDEEEL